MGTDLDEASRTALAAARRLEVDDDDDADTDGDAELAAEVSRCRVIAG